MKRRDEIRIANCSGFFGDRLSAAREMVEGGPIDVLTGDYLAELTMGILARQRARHQGRGYAATFLTQLEDVLAACLGRGIKIVSNAGGLNPCGLEVAIGELAVRLGLDVTVATVSGDDLMDEFADLRLPHSVTGQTFTERVVQPVTANAYLGGWGVAEALRRGADVVVTGRVSDVVVTGRVSDASLVVGPAAWFHEWDRDDWDALSGAVVAGHAIECGAQATGGNYSFFSEIVYWPSTTPQRPSLVSVGMRTVGVEPTTGGVGEDIAGPPAGTVWVGSGEVIQAPIGRITGARSGDKGGDANLGVWARNDTAFRWLLGWLTERRIKELIPEAAELDVQRHPLPNLLAIKFLLKGYLGEGVASLTQMDPQAKSLGEYFRAKVVDMPEELLAV